MNSSQSPHEGVMIRYATREDIPTILALILELAEYEHAAHEVKATPELLEQSIAFATKAGVGEEPEAIERTRPARCLLVFANAAPDVNSDSAAPTPVSASTTAATKEPKSTAMANTTQTCAGLALYFHNYSTWHARAGIYLEDLYIRPAFRRRGLATRLLGELAHQVSEIGGGRLEWSVLKWNQPSIDFYEGEGVGAKMMGDWVGMRVEGEGLVRLAGRR